MKVVIAPQGFKGSLSAMEAARAMEAGLRRVLPDAEVALVPVADGGDGTLEALVESSGGSVRTATVTGPLGEPVEAAWGAMGDGLTAVVEMARASGLVLVPRDRLDPRRATTYGTGELVRHALDAGFRRFIVAIGGSATNDGGAGMAKALGARLLDSDGKGLPEGGAALARLERIDLSGLDPRLRECTVEVATDVSNPLCSPTGASAVYGPQKGATPQMVAELDAALAHYAEVLRRDLGVDVADVPGAGAAGGLGAGLMAFLGAKLRSGVDVVCDAVGLDRHLESASLVLTGEGRLDGQTVFNKAPIGVARRAKARGLPVIAVAGSLGPGYEAVFQHGIDGVEAAVSAPMTLEEALANTPALLAAATERVLRMMVGRGLDAAG
ncbi:MAG: glycerate kinase [Chloroflexi bacterium]|nr:glycerate kinase [Chloroflexota bacterium]